MASQFCAILLVALSAVLAQGASINNNDRRGLVYLGSGVHPVLDKKTGNMTVKASLYYKSMDQDAWTSLEENCKDFLGPSGTPLYMETVEELNDIIQFFATIETGTQYWIGGEWSDAAGGFQWATGFPIGPEWDQHWDDGFPNSETPVTKMMIYKHSIINLKLRTAFLSENHNYICELNNDGTPSTVPPPTTTTPTTTTPTTTTPTTTTPTTTTPTTTPPTTTPRLCLVDNDLVIILDGSISVGQDNFPIGLDFVADIAEAWYANANNRISFIIYGTSAITIFSLDNTLSHQEIMDTIRGAFYPNAPWTNTHLALEGALREFENHVGDNPQNVILLTDGASTSPDDTVRVANLLLGAGVKNFVVGIGQDLDQDELLAIAGGYQERVFNADEFTDLVGLLEPIQEEICF